VLKKKVNVTFPLRNVAYDFVNVMPMATLKYTLAQSIGIDVMDIIGNVSCVGTANQSTVCTLQFFPDDDVAAANFITDFTYNRAHARIYLSELDIASTDNSSMAGGPRLITTDDAYNAADFSAASATDCLNFAPPAQSILNSTTGTCVAICEDGVKDGDESDVDCGGIGCLRCAALQECNNVNDCDPSIKDVVCVQDCSGTSGACKNVCKSPAAALMANPLIVLLGLLITRFLM